MHTKPCCLKLKGKFSCHNHTTLHQFKASLKEIKSIDGSTHAREVNNDAWCVLSRMQFLFSLHIFFPYTCSPIHQIHNLVCPFYKVRLNDTSLQAFVTKHGLQSMANIPIWSMLLTPVENSTQFINFLTLDPHLQILNFIQKYTCMNSN